MKVFDFPGPLGADIRDVDLAAIDDREFEAIYQAWLERGVLRLRNQSLDDPQLEAFSARFGPLEEIPVRLTAEERKQIPSGPKILPGSGTPANCVGGGRCTRPSMRTSVGGPLSGSRTLPVPGTRPGTGCGNSPRSRSPRDSLA